MIVRVSEFLKRTFVEIVLYNTLLNSPYGFFRYGGFG